MMCMQERHPVRFVHTLSDRSFYFESQKLKNSQLKIDGSNKTFDYFREKRKVGDWMVVRELIFV